MCPLHSGGIRDLLLMRQYLINTRMDSGFVCHHMMAGFGWEEISRMGPAGMEGSLILPYLDVTGIDGPVVHP